MRVALVLGGASSLWRDAIGAQCFGPFDSVVACNAAFREWPGIVDHAVTFHTELLPHWALARSEAGRPDAGAYWSVQGAYAPPGLPVRFVPQWGGSSGLITTQVALEVADKAILCGIPLDPEAEHFDRRGPWPDATIHRRAWCEHLPDLEDRVRSMSGWTAELLGEPSEEWRDGRTVERRAARTEGQPEGRGVSTAAIGA